MQSWPTDKQAQDSVWFVPSDAAVVVAADNADATKVKSNSLG